jgi:3-oxoacyl-[acyl-carrier-protein] synthase III
MKGSPEMRERTEGRGWRFAGIGSALPDEVVTNVDLERRLDTSDTWIVERTGIRERRRGGSTASLAIEAGRAALEMARLPAIKVDMLFLSTSTPDRQVPATSARVHSGLGLGGGAADINAACSGWLYALIGAGGLLASGLARSALVIGSEHMSRIIDANDRSTAILFGDGAGAVVLVGDDGPSPLISSDVGCNGDLEEILFANHSSKVVMNGAAVFREAVRIVDDSSRRCLDRAGVTVQDVRWVVPHQANLRLMFTIADRMGVERSRVVQTVQWTGNVSSASIPIALDALRKESALQPGDLVLLQAFGAGFTWVTALLRWR